MFRFIVILAVLVLFSGCGWVSDRVMTTITSYSDTHSSYLVSRHTVGDIVSFRTDTSAHNGLRQYNITREFSTADSAIAFAIRDYNHALMVVGLVNSKPKAP
jgi:predicted Zn-dependent protease